MRLGDTCGEWKAVICRCPQGSSLGPVLWNFCKNDLFYENGRSQLSAYADDHQILNKFRVRRLTTSSAVLRRMGIQLVAGINPTTSRVIHRNIKYRSCQAKQEVKKAVQIDGNTIRQAQEIKLLGVILDVNLQFSEHIKQICTKTSTRIGVLCRLKESDPHNSKTNNL